MTYYEIEVLIYKQRRVNLTSTNFSNYAAESVLGLEKIDLRLIIGLRSITQKRMCHF